GSDHLPISVLLPLADHSELVWRLRDQINFTVPKRKRLWQQIVKAKIRAQAFNLPKDYPAYGKLIDLSRKVASGDSTNVEAQAAKIYWQNWLWHEEFRREYDGDGLNAFLNYGYAVLRAAVARSIVAAGLTPMLGLHHHHRANPFCLADDLMEPLRAMVDDRVRDMHRIGYDALNQPAKSELLGILTQDIEIEGTISPLTVGLGKYISSLVRCYSTSSNNLSIPIPCT
ncbi:MAG: type II CRISPR-associated endonuclease Cas1, partial [Planctomycetes bacterium]|nr:type II CRISPR-associated endonuclease Cas1 [Planctomycetota bacterium]